MVSLSLNILVNQNLAWNLRVTISMKELERGIQICIIYQLQIAIGSIFHLGHRFHLNLELLPDNITNLRIKNLRKK